MSELIIVNPSARGNHQERRWFDTEPRFILWFGACAPTYLMVWGDLENALETAADWLADNAPGLIMTHDSEELQELFDEAMAELYPEAESIDSLDSHQVDACQEKATADLTYTEAGYLTSYEWGIALDEHATRADVKAFIEELESRHYTDDPVVQVAKS